VKGGVIVACTFLAAALLTGLVRRVALRRGVLDVPNERSSHAVPTARGGGIAIVAACLAAWAVMLPLGLIAQPLFFALTGGGALVAVVGLLDDHRPLAPPLRLAAHFLAAVWAIYSLGGLPPVQLGEATVNLGTAGDVLAVLGIVWVLNLFNFMDGIDGIAGSEAIFVVVAGALLSALLDTAPGWIPSGLALVAASGGFLVWNWPPARIFMGDVGSGFLGFVIAVLAVAATAAWPAAFLVWLILGALFFVDATITLVLRLLRGERVHLAHRSHAYQHLATRHGHKRVTFGWIALNIAGVLPCAVAAAFFPGRAPWIAGGLVVVLGVAAYVLGAGRPASQSMSASDDRRKPRQDPD
jgi:Fuc2NAc and GlcNAc transferase